MSADQHQKSRITPSSSNIDLATGNEIINIFFIPALQIRDAPEIFKGNEALKRHFQPRPEGLTSAAV
ncbi:hypothetical protein [Paracoccus seriniphilus]|uniref:hypothetical protein n=1 Tax=Paracoccus seriniphilus TaxID=184748 RepID=UPI0023504F90|nr:hypothetical protein [Paracoccus seriniphilus]WCR16232.1 hypothetical protein JHW44_16540 [Paracoccus seriniphilus]